MAVRSVSFRPRASVRAFDVDRLSCPVPCRPLSARVRLINFSKISGYSPPAGSGAAAVPFLRIEIVIESTREKCRVFLPATRITRVPKAVYRKFLRTKKRRGVAGWGGRGRLRSDCGSCGR